MSSFFAVTGKPQRKAPAILEPAEKALSILKQEAL